MPPEVRLHLGCGSNVVPGWENIDKSPGVILARFPRLRRFLFRARVLTREQAGASFPPGIVRADIRNGLDYPTGSASYVYSSHTIEHMSRWQAQALLAECRRVLRTGGTIRLATPDLAAIVAVYLQDKARNDPRAADAFVHDLYTFRELEGSRAQRLVQRLITAPHQWLYDSESLCLLLEEAGFVGASPCSYRSGTLPDLELLEARPESLFVEAKAP
jgi:predicted SAM-dependent methyltransferase